MGSADQTPVSKVSGSDFVMIYIRMMDGTEYWGPIIPKDSYEEWDFWCDELNEDVTFDTVTTIPCG